MQSAAELSDGELVLRPWREGDAEAVGFTPASPEIGRYFGLPHGGPREPDPDAPAFAILDGGVPVGRIWFAPQVRPFEVGYYLRPDAWGRGLATRSLRLVCAWMQARGERQIALCTHPGNARSQRVAERAGFHPAGEVAEYAHFKDGTTRALRYLWP
jgi:RimJ/RimL family protein N-acetyltransferase